MHQPALRPAWIPTPAPHTTIVFVHGAVVNGWEMVLLRHRFRRLGYRVRQFHYPSMWRGLAENTRRLRDFLRRTEGDVLHVVAHSMGGVLTRQVFESDPDPRPGRLIAVGSPLLDCWIAHRVSGLHDRGYCLLGKTVHDHIRQTSDPIWRGTREFGVLAGTFPFGIGCIFPNLPRPSDGVILLEETRLGGITDHVTCRLNHFGMLLSQRCLWQMAQFLATGAFVHSEREGPP